jgi:hypothetical protein
MKKRLVVFCGALLVCYVAAVFLVSQFNIERITGFGIEVSIMDRIVTAYKDIVNMYLYLPLIAIALCIAFLFAHYVLGRYLKPNLATYLIVGFIGLITIHVSMEVVFGLVVVAPTRTIAGLASQGLAGAIGSWLYYQFHVAPANKQ